MKRVLACSVAFAAPATSLLVNHEDTLATDSEGTAEDFDAYIETFGRSYAVGSQEYNMRLGLYRQRVARINEQNAKPNALWSATINHLTDRTESELSMLTGWRGINKGSGAAGGASFLETEVQFLDEEKWNTTVDYRSLKMAKNVPEQAACGSCWAVATSALLEANSEIHVGDKRTFSVQQLVNCVPNPKECGGQGGCKGATVELGMGYIEKMGLLQEHELPYEAVDQKCSQPMTEGKGSLVERHRGHHSAGVTYRGGAAIGLQSWKTLDENKVTPLVHALMQGPVAISVGASGGWHSYEGGVFDNCTKDSVINHAVVLFGMGRDTKKNKNYWLVRNSWGTGWGEDGYIRLLRQDSPEEEDGYCGTDHDPSKGIACKPYPDSVKVCGMCGILYDSVAVQMGPMGGKGKEEPTKGKM